MLQRTRLVEETQELLLQLLGDMTTGTEAETAQFMAVCVQTLRRCRRDDLVTPVFVVERLCSIIHPEEKDDVEFLLSLDKDPQQEDFLQGQNSTESKPSFSHFRHDFFDNSAVSFFFVESTVPIQRLMPFLHQQN